MRNECGLPSDRQHHPGRREATIVLHGGRILIRRPGKRENRDIQQPGLATPADITGAARRGVIYNDVAYGCGIAAGLSAIVAVPLITLNLDPGEIEVHATGGAGAGGVSLSGRF